jgi:hypothetical protein
VGVDAPEEEICHRPTQKGDRQFVLELEAAGFSAVVGPILFAILVLRRPSP